MRGFVIAMAGAAVLAGCSPFEHGHYADDVNYVNSGGDPAGTPVVYNSLGGGGYSTAGSTQTAYKSWKHHGSHAGHGHHASHSAPVNYSVPVHSSGYQPAIHSTHATSYGGVEIDADGYAICKESWHQTSSAYPRY